MQQSDNGLHSGQDQSQQAGWNYSGNEKNGSKSFNESVGYKKTTATSQWGDSVNPNDHQQNPNDVLNSIT